jgi:hypothetical protein
MKGRCRTGRALRNARAEKPELRRKIPAEIWEPEKTGRISTTARHTSTKNFRAENFLHAGRHKLSTKNDGKPNLSSS